MAAPILSRRERIVAAVARSNSVPLSASSRSRCISVYARAASSKQLVGREAVAACTGSEQIELCLLDAVLGLAPGAVQPLVQLYGVAFEIGHDKARVVALAAMLESRDHATLDVPAVGRVSELVDQTLLGAAALVLVGEHQFGVSHPRFQASVASQPDDVAHARALAPAQQSLAAEPGVAAHDDPALGPGLAQPLHQQLDHRRRVLRAVDPTAPEHARQHRLAAEHIQRQVAVVVVVGMELGTLWLPCSGTSE